MLVRLPMTDFKMTIRADCVVSVCSPFPQPVKDLVHCFYGWGKIFLWTGFCPLPCQLLAFKRKQTFLSTNLTSSLVYWAASIWTPLLVKTETAGHEKTVLDFRNFIYKATHNIFNNQFSFKASYTLNTIWPEKHALSQKHFLLSF